MSKKSLLVLAVTLSMVAILAIGGTLAYFTDKTEVVSNTFSVGKVEITLDEAVVEPIDGTNDYEATDERTEKGNEYKLYPGIVVPKDPTIHVAEESNEAYVAAKVTVTCKGLYDIYGVEGYDTIAIHNVVSGGLMAAEGEGSYGTKEGLFGFDNGKCFVHQVVVEENNKWELYIFVNDVQAADDDVILFEKLSIDPLFTNDQMAVLENLQIDIEAYAVQADEFEDCVKAIQTAHELVK